MLTYTFSKREKVLLAILAVVILAIVWFVFVFQRTTAESAAIDSQIADAKSEIALESAKVTQIAAISRTIEERKNAGVQPTTLPDYDNMTALMAELDRVLAGTGSYAISFDELDTTSSAGYALRGAEISFECGSYDQAKAVTESLVHGPFSCSVDQLDLNTGSGSSGVSVTLHIIYFERMRR